MQKKATTPSFKTGLIMLNLKTVAHHALVVVCGLLVSLSISSRAVTESRIIESLPKGSSPGYKKPMLDTRFFFLFFFSLFFSPSAMTNALASGEAHMTGNKHPYLTETPHSKYFQFLTFSQLFKFLNLANGILF